MCPSNPLAGSTYYDDSTVWRDYQRRERFWNILSWPVVIGVILLGWLVATMIVEVL